MTDHLSFEQLSDLEDGVLDAVEAALARAHLTACAPCAAGKAAITALGAAASALPRDIAPPDDLWTDIRREVAVRNTIPRGGMRGWSLPRLAAAAVFVAVVSSGATVMALRANRIGAASGSDATSDIRRPPPASADVTSPAPDALALPARLASTERAYTRSAAVLQRTLDERRDSLAPSTVATVERSLRVADSAIAEARAALAHDPANRALVALFASNYERKIDLLRRATELAPRT